MKFNMSANTILEAQAIANDEMKIIAADYEAIGDQLDLTRTRWEKFKDRFRWPQSLRLYHFAEFTPLTADNRDQLREMIILRKKWHAWWSIRNTMLQLPDSMAGREDIELNEYELENFTRINMVHI